MPAKYNSASEAKAALAITRIGDLAKLDEPFDVKAHELNRIRDYIDFVSARMWNEQEGITNGSSSSNQEATTERTGIPESGN